MSDDRLPMWALAEFFSKCSMSLRSLREEKLVGVGEHPGDSP